MAQKVKNVNAAAGVTAELQVQSPFWQSGLKDPALVHLQLGFNPWPGVFYMNIFWPLKKKKKRVKVERCDYRTAVNTQRSKKTQNSSFIGNKKGQIMS